LEFGGGASLRRHMDVSRVTHTQPNFSLAPRASARLMFLRPAPTAMSTAPLSSLFTDIASSTEHLVASSAPPCDALPTAYRIMACARPGEVLTSEAAWRIGETAGARLLKGVPGTWQLFRAA